MNWGSASEFFAMGGHALYVWGSYGVTAVLIIAETLWVKSKQQQTRQRLARMAQARAAKVVQDEDKA